MDSWRLLRGFRKASVGARTADGESEACGKMPILTRSSPKKPRNMRRYKQGMSAAQPRSICVVMVEDVEVCVLVGFPATPGQGFIRVTAKAQSR